jgi:hypothetical protein
MPDDTAVIERTVAPPAPPAPPAPVAATGFGAFSIAHLPLSLQILFNPELNRQCVSVANYLSKAEGITPAHLLGKHEACFAVVARSLTWQLDPFAVAGATYQTPDKKVGYYGSLCQSIIENSGRLEGGVRYAHYGDWAQVRGRFKIVERPSSRDNNRVVRAPEQQWTDEDEIGIGVTVSALIKGEASPREMNFDMAQAYPRYSTLWITDPMTQIQYTAVRRFATSVVPTLFMGVPFDREDYDDWADTLRDVTPVRPQLGEYGPQGKTEPSPRQRSRRRQEADAHFGNDGEDPPLDQNPAARAETSKVNPPQFFFADADGIVHEDFASFEEAVADYASYLEAAAKQGEKPLITAWDSGAQLLANLRETGHDSAADALSREYSKLVSDLDKPAPGGEQGPPAGGGATKPPAARAPSPAAKSAPGELPLADQAGGDPADVEVPRGILTSQGWFPLAKAKLKAMSEAKRPPTEFALFRSKNAEALQKLEDELPNWWKILDNAIKAEFRP